MCPILENNKETWSKRSENRYFALKNPKINQNCVLGDWGRIWPLFGVADVTSRAYSFRTLLL